MKDREKEAETQADGEAGGLMWDSIPGLQDHALSWRQALNHWATQASHDFSLMTALMPVQIMGISDLVDEVKNLNTLNAFKCT